MNRRVRFFPMSFFAQMAMAVLLPLLAISTVGGITVARNEYHFLEENTQEQAELTISLVASLISKPVMDNDMAAVETTLRNLVNLSPALSYIEVLAQSGDRIARFPENLVDQTKPVTEFRGGISFEDLNLGEVVFHWATEPGKIRTAQHVKETVLFLLAGLAVAGMLLLFTISRLARSPLSIINAKMSATIDRDRLDHRKLPKFAAREFISLSTSVDTLEEILHESDQREERLKLKQKAMETASRSKSEFLANMSHEIRTPMNGILGMAELLLETKLNSDQRIYAETIAKSGSALMPIINDILDFSKMESGKLNLHPAPFDLHRSIEDVVTMTSSKAYQKNVEINLRYAPDLPTGFIADVGRIRQILTNILGNAVKFTSEGHILIDVSGRSHDNRTHLTIEISDTGVGIAEDNICFIFDEFEQSNAFPGRQIEGTGLGLTISSRLVRMMGGTIEVNSEPNKGSVFTIQLTLEHSKEFTRANFGDVRDLLNRKVLIVDDLQINRTILSERLRNWGVLHKAVSSGMQALEVLESAEMSGDSFDAIIVDYHMPGMNGCELAEKIRAIKSCAAIPIILLSSVDVTCEPLSESPSIFEIYLLKPVRSDTLKAVLANAVAKKDAKTMPQPEETRPAPKKSGLNGMTILIAEDNKTNQLVLQTMLKTFELNVITVQNGQEALQSYAASEPDMILMDMAMPVMDGLDATRQIRELERQNGRARTPIIALTANAMSGDRDNCLNAGMDDYLSKPVIKSQLVATMEKWIFEEAGMETHGGKTSDDIAPASQGGAV